MTTMKSPTLSDTLYTTGALIQAQLVNGIMRWIVVCFVEDTFFDGNTLNPSELADTFEGLFPIRFPPQED